MSVISRSASLDAPAGDLYDLVHIAISVEPRRLESLLDALSQVGFPVNPEIFHSPAPGGSAATTHTRVVFPAFHRQIDAVRETLRSFSFDWKSVEVREAYRV